MAVQLRFQYLDFSGSQPSDGTDNGSTVDGNGLFRTGQRNGREIPDLAVLDVICDLAGISGGTYGQ